MASGRGGSPHGITVRIPAIQPHGITVRIPAIGRITEFETR
jgi:uncharacterized protein YwbE